MFSAALAWDWQNRTIEVTSHALRAYVLCGWPKDTLEDATRRMGETLAAGFMPMAMLYRGDDGCSQEHLKPSKS